jgi:polysaccharide biosynthesis protein PslJ
VRVVAGAAQRGPVVPSAVVICGLALLSLTVLSGVGVMAVAVLVAAAAVGALTYRSFLQWRIFVAAIILVILFVPTRRYALPGHLPFNLEPYRILVALVLGGWLVSLLVDPKVRLAGSVFDRQIGLLVAAVLASDVLNPGRVNSVGSSVPKALSFFLSYVLVYYLIVSVVRDWRTIDFLLKLLVGGGAVIGVFALIERRTDYNVFNHLHGIAPFLKFQGAIGATGLARGGTRLRVYGPAEHPIALGALFVILIPLGIYLARQTGKRRWWLAVAVLSLGAFATVSRTAVVMLAVVALVFLRLRPKETKRLSSSQSWPPCTLRCPERSGASEPRSFRKVDSLHSSRTWLRATSCDRTDGWPTSARASTRCRVGRFSGKATEPASSGSTRSTTMPRSSTISGSERSSRRGSSASWRGSGSSAAASVA